MEGIKKSNTFLTTESKKVSPSKDGKYRIDPKIYTLIASNNASTFKRNPLVKKNLDPEEDKLSEKSGESMGKFHLNNVVNLSLTMVM